MGSYLIWYFSYMYNYLYLYSECHNTGLIINSQIKWNVVFQWFLFN